MATLNEIVVEALDILAALIREDLSVKRIDATGNASASLQVIGSGSQYSLIGLDYLEYLNRGRAPGKYPPIEAIARWVEFKNIIANPYLIARKIAQEGTEIYKDRSKGIMLEEKIIVLQDNINEQLPNFIRDKIVTEINKAFK